MHSLTCLIEVSPIASACISCPSLPAVQASNMLIVSTASATMPISVTQQHCICVSAATLACAGLGLADGVPASVLAARLHLHGLVVERVTALLGLRLRLAVVHQAHRRAVDDVVLVVDALVHLRPQLFALGQKLTLQRVIL